MDREYEREQKVKPNIRFSCRNMHKATESNSTVFKMQSDFVVVVIPGLHIAYACHTFASIDCLTQIPP